jgi:hypothetical protein
LQNLTSRAAILSIMQSRVIIQATFSQFRRGPPALTTQGTAPLPSVNTSKCTEYSRACHHPLSKGQRREQSPILQPSQDPSSVSDFRYCSVSDFRTGLLHVIKFLFDAPFRPKDSRCTRAAQSREFESAHDVITDVRGKWAFSRQAFAVVPASLGAPATRRSTRALSDDVLADNTRSTIGGGGRIQGADGRCSRVRTRALTL